MSGLLYEGLLQLGMEARTAALCAQKLHTYIAELQLFNAVYDLTAAKDTEEIEIRHILDSLAAYGELLQLKKSILQNKAAPSGADKPDTYVDSAPNAALSFTIADIGSGGGLPGIPLAIAMPDTDFVLVERMSKRCLFLENCAAVLGLKNVRIQNTEAERIPHNSFDIAVFRAFHPLEKKTLRILLRILKDGGFLAAYKAKKEKIAEEMNAVRQFVSSFKIIPLHVPFLEDRERNLVVIPKAPPAQCH